MNTQEQLDKEEYIQWFMKAKCQGRLGRNERRDVKKQWCGIQKRSAKEEKTRGRVEVMTEIRRTAEKMPRP